MAIPALGTVAACSPVPGRGDGCARRSQIRQTPSVRGVPRGTGNMFMLVLPTRAVRPGEGPPNPAQFLDSSLYPQKRARAPVIMPKAVEFKLPTTDGFPWLLHLILELSRRPTCPDSRPPKYTTHDLRHSCASWPDFLAAKEVIKRCDWLSFSLFPKPPDIAIYNPKSHSHRIHSNI